MALERWLPACDFPTSTTTQSVDTGKRPQSRHHRPHHHFRPRQADRRTQPGPYTALARDPGTTQRPLRAAAAVQPRARHRLPDLPDTPDDQRIPSPAELDRAGTRTAFESVADAAGVSPPGSIPRPTSRTRPGACAPQPVQTYRRDPGAAAPATTSCVNAATSHCAATVNSPKRTGGCAANSPTRQAHRP